VSKKLKKNWKKIIAQYEAIRRLGQTNMFRKYMVQRIAFENGFYELVNAIQDDYTEVLKNYSKYIKMIKEKDIPKAYPIEISFKLRR